MSNALKSLSLLAATGLALAGSPLSADARGVSARSGSSAYFSEGGCWAPNGPTMTNSYCSGFRAWHSPLILDGSLNGWFYPTVTATAVGNAGNLVCQAMSTDRYGNLVMASGYFMMSAFNTPTNLILSVWVPTGGVAMIDCFANQGSSVHSVNY